MPKINRRIIGTILGAALAVSAAFAADADRTWLPSRPAKEQGEAPSEPHLEMPAGLERAKAGFDVAIVDGAAKLLDVSPLV